MAVITVSATRMEVEQVMRLAEGELLQLLTERGALLRRIAILRRTIAGLAETFGEDLLPEGVRALIKPAAPKTRGTGLTEACRAALANSSQPLTAREVVDRIRNVDAAIIKDHKDPVASVTSILHRLGSYGEATTQVTHSGRRMWTPAGNDRHN
jgi:hypothetical protein